MCKVLPFLQLKVNTAKQGVRTCLSNDRDPRRARQLAHEVAIGMVFVLIGIGDMLGT